MSRLFRLQVSPDELTDEFFAFVVDPRAARGERPIIDELHETVPEMVEVLESMVLDGVEERRDVADYVDYITAQYA